MNSTFNLDPAYGIAKAFITIGMVFCGVMVAVFGYMVYLAGLGILSDWSLSVQSPLVHFYPEANSIFWHMVFFSIPAFGFLVFFFLLGWVGKKIQQESLENKV